MALLYLDYNCFQRGFDDPQQVRIRLEALACQEIFRLAEVGTVNLVWSFMHLDETILCPFPERRQEALRLADLCRVRVGADEAIRARADRYCESTRVSPKDALHLACAAHADAGAFVTCDDRLTCLKEVP